MIQTREEREAFELAYLSPLACASARSEGREQLIEPDVYRTCFQRDRDRIIHCKAFRRLSHKTQVFLAPSGDHYRTRLTHTLEVAQIARSIARPLKLNEDLTEAIALGHDMGHTPFGHTGEDAITRCVRTCLDIPLDDDSEAGRFRHNLQSKRVVEVLEHDGSGLNLTFEVRDGIACHSGALRATTLEGRLVAISDRIAYVNHDIDDAIRAGIITESQLPPSTHALLGHDHSARITTLVTDLVETSAARGDIVQSEAVASAFLELRSHLFKTVYRNESAKAEEPKANRLIEELFIHYLDHIDEVPDDIRRVADRHPSSVAQGDRDITAVVDYIAGMTDRYARDTYEELFVPSSWRDMR